MALKKLGISVVGSGIGAFLLAGYAHLSMVSVLNKQVPKIANKLEQYKKNKSTDQYETFKNELFEKPYASTFEKYIGKSEKNDAILFEAYLHLKELELEIDESILLSLYSKMTNFKEIDVAIRKELEKEYLSEIEIRRKYHNEIMESSNMTKNAIKNTIFPCSAKELVDSGNRIKCHFKNDFASEMAKFMDLDKVDENILVGGFITQKEVLNGYMIRDKKYFDEEK